MIRNNFFALACIMFLLFPPFYALADCILNGNIQALINSTPGQYNSQAAFDISLTDDATAGECAKGVANILEQEGFPVTRGDAYTWAQSLVQDGWHQVANCSPSNAPVGAVLVYDRNNPPGSSGGAKYGHVEIVSNVDGQRYYISDKARTNSGGTVPQNFVGCYVY